MTVFGVDKIIRKVAYEWVQCRKCVQLKERFEKPGSKKYLLWTRGAAQVSQSLHKVTLGWLVSLYLKTEC